jgi:hypothetical protein
VLDLICRSWCSWCSGCCILQFKGCCLLLLELGLLDACCVVEGLLARLLETAIYTHSEDREGYWNCWNRELRFFLDVVAFFHLPSIWTRIVGRRILIRQYVVLGYVMLQLGFLSSSSFLSLQNKS